MDNQTETPTSKQHLSARRGTALLVAINVVLIAVLTLVAFTPANVRAQGLGGGSDKYLMISGSTSQRVQDIVYVINVTRGQMLAFIVNTNDGSITPVGRSLTNVGEDLKRAGRRR